MQISIWRKSALKTFDTSLYFITDSTGFTEEEFLRRTEAALQGGVTLLQLREKEKSTREYLVLAEKVHKLTRKYHVPLIIDDRLDIAMAAHADGVHLGQDDFPLPEAKNLAPEMFFGVSTHNAEEIDRALAEGCSYLNIGPMFPTRTKSVACGALGLETIEELAKKVTCHFSVMGGIKEHHLELLTSKGFKHIAMVTEITQAPDVEAKVRQLRNLMKGVDHE
jgi:thiamine-phosphate pyrophosphorylase